MNVIFINILQCSPVLLGSQVLCIFIKQKYKNSLGHAFYLKEIFKNIIANV